MSNQPKTERRHFKLTDTIAAAQIGTRLTTDIMNVTERLHLSILKQLSPSNTTPMNWLSKSTKLIYRGIKIAPTLSGHALTSIARRLPTSEDNDTSPARRKAIAALNGAIGDQLQRTSNPIATKFAVHHWDETAEFQLVFIHGLCMDDQAWSRSQCAELAHDLNASACYVRYNSGLAIKENGRALAEFLRARLQKNQRIALIGHSMGGLVAHTALHSQSPNNSEWLRHVSHIITLGTPHAGAPLAQLGHWSEQRLAANPFTRPFTNLSGQRSIGIRDLQHGFQPDTTTPCDSFCIAGRVSESSSRINKTIGDGLVTVASALALSHANESTIIENCHHLDLLRNPEVFQQMFRWLGQANEYEFSSRLPVKT